MVRKQFESSSAERAEALQSLPADTRTAAWVDATVVCLRVVNGLYGAFDAADPTRLAPHAASASKLSKN